MTSTKTEILTEVTYDEIVQISHVESRLKKNFQLIVQELRKQGGSNSSNNKDIGDLKDQVSSLRQQLANLNKSLKGYVSKEELQKQKADMMKQFQELITGHKNQVASMVGQVQQMAERSIKSANPEKSDEEQREKDHQLTQSLNESVQKSSGLLKSLQSQVDKLKINNAAQEQSIIRLLNQVDELKKKKPKAVIEPKPLVDQQLQEKVESGRKISEASTTANLEERVKSLEDKIAELNTNSNQLKELLKQKDHTMQTHTKQIWQINEKIFAQDKANTDEHKLFKQAIDSIKKAVEGSSRPKSSINDLGMRVQDLERKADLLIQNNDIISKNLKGCQDQIETLVTHMNTSKGASSIMHNQTVEMDSKEFAKDDVRRELLLKLGDQRREYMTMLKNLSNLQNATTEEEKAKLLQDAIAELRFLLNKKADEENTRKAIVFLQKKINYIFNTFLNMTEDDARIGRKNWFCLSCDKRLDHFTGKLGEHIPSPGPKGGKLASTVNLVRGVSDVEKNTSEQPGGLLSSRFKSKTKLDLPSVHTTAKRN